MEHLDGPSVPCRGLGLLLVVVVVVIGGIVPSPPQPKLESRRRRPDPYTRDEQVAQPQDAGSDHGHGALLELAHRVRELRGAHDGLFEQ
jgi:hypothetical protein